MTAEPEFAIVVAGDSNPEYLQGLAVTIYSTLQHLDRGCRPAVYVLDCGLPEGAFTRLSKVALRARPDIEIQLLAIDPRRVDAMSSRSSQPSGKYARLFVDQLVAETVRRVVYLDADVLVRRDVSPLFSMDFGGAPIAAVQELLGSTVADRHIPYFNSGVLVIDVVAWRNLRIGDSVLSYIAEHARELPGADQDALNAVISTWHPLDFSWNLQLGGLVKDLAWHLPEAWTDAVTLASLHRQMRDGPVIFHFTVRKPWHASHGPLPGSWAWAMCLMRSRWHGPVQSRRRLLRWVWGRWRHMVGTGLQHLRASP